ncbi:MAG: 4-hydroxy-tetrahydrodipicolinate reductase [Myxococcales bacterium]|nr:4-hydroxy-tetrahydrodipicolinate reductase [Myxococcales bacterium]
MTRIAIHGAAGRMGRAVIDQILAREGAELGAALERSGHGSLGCDAATLVGRSDPLGVMLGDDLAAGLERVEVAIDFSLPEGTGQLLAACAAAGCPAVVGTTGLDAAGREALEACASRAPVVYAPNFSVGVNLFWALARRAVELAGDEFDLEIVEMHHRRKVDAPSGTAARLLEVVAEARGLEPERAAVHGRSGRPGARTREEIGVHALRGGDVVGDHTLLLAGPGERLELTHRAHSREIFAAGAVRAAIWVVGREPGLYDMADVLGISVGRDAG